MPRPPSASRSRRRAATVLAVALVGLLVAASCGGADGSTGSGGEGETTTTTAPEPTTTTISPEQQALDGIAAMDAQQLALLDLLANPPQFPPPLAPLPVAEPGPPVRVAQLGPDRLPVLNPVGEPAVFSIRFDHRGQIVTDEAGNPAIEGEGSLVYGDDGRPILLAPEYDPAGGFVRDDAGQVKLNPLPAPGPLNPVMLIGDSVILGTEPALPDGLPGWTVTLDAAEGRLPGNTDDLIRDRRGEIGRAAVVMVGHNAGAAEDHDAYVRAIIAALDGVERVVLVTASEWGPGQVAFNEAVRRIAPEHPNVHVAEWARYNTAHPDYTYDQLHLTPPGRDELVRLIAGYLGPAPEQP